MKKVRVEKKIGNEVLSFETGQLAKQAGGCVIVQYGDTVVLNSATTGSPRPGIDFFPLTCDYRERTAAAGKFPGGFIKREGRPTMKETLTSRLIDRPIRPMFAEGFKDEVQCQAMVLSSDAGGVVPLNFLLGSVQRYESLEFYGEATVAPAVKFTELTDVFVILPEDEAKVLAEAEKADAAAAAKAPRWTMGTLDMRAAATARRRTHSHTGNLAKSNRASALASR